MTTAVKDVRYGLSPQVVIAPLRESVLALEGESIRRLDGPGIQQFVTHLAALLRDGKYLSVDDILGSVSGEINSLQQILDLLVDEQFLVVSDGPVSPFAVLAAQRSGMRVTAKAAQDGLDTNHVVIGGRHWTILGQRILQGLQETGVQVEVSEEVESCDPSKFLIALGESEYDPLFRSLNSGRLDSSGAPWLTVIPFNGSTAWVGPFMVPNKSACYTCFRLRRSSTFTDEVIHGDLLDLYAPPKGSSSVEADGTSMVVAGLVADLAFQWAALGGTAPATTPGGVASVSIARSGIDINRTRVLKVPRCPDCSPTRYAGPPQVWHHQEGDVVPQHPQRDDSKGASPHE